jgi:hypothetical protein
MYIVYLSILLTPEITFTSSFNFIIRLTADFGRCNLSAMVFTQLKGDKEEELGGGRREGGN